MSSHGGSWFWNNAMLNKITYLLTTTLFVSTLAAQTTWVVDAQNGSGTDFLDLPEAIAASSSGDTVLVRYADPLLFAYTGPTITHGVTIVGVGGPPGISGELRIESLPADEHVVVRNLQMAPFAAAHGLIGTCSLIIDSNVGSVHLQSVHRRASALFFGAGNQWVVADSSLVSFSHCAFRMIDAIGGARITNTDLVTFEFTGLASTAIATPTLELSNSRLVMTNSEVKGFAPIFGVGGPGIEMCGAELQLVGGTVTGGTSAFAVQSGSGCVGANSIDLHGGGTVGPVSGVAPVQSHVHALAGFLHDTHLVLRVSGPPAGFAVLAFGQPASLPVPALGGTLFLDAATIGVFAVAELGVTGATAWDTYLLPGVPTGASAWLQALTLDPAGAMTLTTPAVVTKS